MHSHSITDMMLREDNFWGGGCLVTRIDAEKLPYCGVLRECMYYVDQPPSMASIWSNLRSMCLQSPSLSASLIAPQPSV